MILSKLKSKNKKAALELSIGTIVVLVLAMSMLILGLILVRTIFGGAKDNVDTINEKVKEQINKLFVEDQRIVVNLANQEARVKQNEEFGVSFGLRNLKKGVQGTSKFRYTVTLNNPTGTRRNCGGLSENDALRYIKAGDEGTLNILPGETKYEIIRFSVPEGAPLCIIRYTIDIRDVEAGQGYDSINFDLNVVA